MSNSSSGRLARVVTMLSRISYTYLAIAQGGYYLVGGLWPFVGLASFERITGAKTDLWLVHTTGLLLAVIGVVLVVAGIRWRVTMEILILAVGTASVLAGIEVYYVTKGMIAPVYLLDTLLELAFIAVWLSVRTRKGANHEAAETLFDSTLSRSRDERE